jgi:hypothetical protein
MLKQQSTPKSTLTAIVWRGKVDYLLNHEKLPVLYKDQVLCADTVARGNGRHCVSYEMCNLFHHQTLQH